MGGYFSAYHTQKRKIKPGSYFLMSSSDGQESQSLMQEQPHLATTYQEPDTVLSVSDTAVRKTDRNPCLQGAYVCMQLKGNQGRRGTQGSISTG